MSGDPNSVASPCSPSTQRGRHSTENLASRIFVSHPGWLWSISAVLLLIAAAWAYSDPHIDYEVFGSEELAARAATIDATMKFVSGTERGKRWIWMLMISLGAGSSLFLLALGLIRGSRKFRSLKSLLVFVTHVCLWVGLLAGLPNISWLGKQSRVTRLLEDFEPIVTELQADWPDDDGRSPTLGQYMAYPVGQPSTLFLLTPPVFQPSGTKVSQIEGSETGGIRFHLAGSELGDWLEFHPAGQHPESFQGGLQQNFQLIRSQNLREGWFLARYQLVSSL